MFVLSHANIVAQLEAFFSIDGGLGNSKEAEVGSGRDMSAVFVKEYQTQVRET